MNIGGSKGRDAIWCMSNEHGEQLFVVVVLWFRNKSVIATGAPVFEFIQKISRY